MCMILSSLIRYFVITVEHGVSFWILNSSNKCSTLGQLLQVGEPLSLTSLTNSRARAGMQGLQERSKYPQRNVTMSHLIDRLVQRSIVEQFWDIVLDTDEVPSLPNEEALLAQIEAETDDEASDELLLQYLDAHARHFNTAPLIGGPLSDFADIVEVDGEPIMVGLVVPSLRTL